MNCQFSDHASPEWTIINLHSDCTMLFAVHLKHPGFWPSAEVNPM